MDVKGRIFVVDDEPDFTAFVKWQLENLTYGVETAGSGEEALLILEQQAFDVLIADIRMPGMDGIELIQKAMVFHPDIQCIVITGHGDIDTAISAMRAGAVNYLQKPVGVNALDIAIEKALEKLHLIRDVKSKQAQLEDANRELLIIRAQLENSLLEEKSQRKKAEEALAAAMLRENLVEVLSLSLRFWKQTTQKTKFDFAEESRIWTASVDNSGTFRTRTLDKYLKVSSLPPNPRYGDVLDTAYFVLSKCSLTQDMRATLEKKVSDLEKLIQ